MVSVAVTGHLYALYVLGALGRRTRFQTSDLAQLVLNVTVSEDVTVGGAGSGGAQCSTSTEWPRANQVSNGTTCTGAAHERLCWCYLLT